MLSIVQKIVPIPYVTYHVPVRHVSQVNPNEHFALQSTCDTVLSVDQAVDQGEITNEKLNRSASACLDGPIAAVIGRRGARPRKPLIDPCWYEISDEEESLEEEEVLEEEESLGDDESLQDEESAQDELSQIEEGSATPGKFDGSSIEFY